MLRLLGELVIIALGITIVVIRFLFPDITFGGYETYTYLNAIEWLWALGGHILDIVISICGLYILVIVQKLGEKMGCL